MKELGNSNSRRVLINAKDRNSNSRRGFIPKEYRRRSSTSHARDYSKQSYLISITIPQPKLGIKIPKFLVKNMRIKFHRIDDHDHTYNQTNKKKNEKKKKKWTEKLLPKKGASIFSKFFGNKKKSSSSKNDQLDVNGLDDFYSLLVEGTTSEEDQPIFDDEDKRSKVRPQKVSLPLAYFFNMEKNEKNNKNNGDDVGNSNGLMVIGRQESSRHLIRIPSRKSTSSRRKLRIAIYVRKMGNDNKTAIRSEERDVGQELCKKRILMGGKCKPLNLSGTLQYDNNGILLPEAIGD